MPDTIPILVTGGEGMLGHAFAQQGRQFERFAVVAPGRGVLDVRDPAAVAAWADWVGGGWIVHCAALVDVEGCARDPEGARATIVEGTRNVANLAKRAGARLLYPQSFLTYDAQTNPIPEDETPRPLSLYGALKYEAEQVACGIVDDALIVRMAGFFGGEARDKNFVGKIVPVMHAAMLRGEADFAVGTRVWQPTWTDDLAYNALHLMAVGASGSYQMASVGQASFADVAREIVAALGWGDRLRIVAVDPSAVAGGELGRRPDAAVLACTRLTAERRNLQRPWAATLNAYLSAPFFDRYRMDPRS